MIFSLTKSIELKAHLLAERGLNIQAYQLIEKLLARPDAVGLQAARLHRFAARMCYRICQYDQMRVHLVKAHRAYPKSTTAAKLLAKYYSRLGERKRARKWRLFAGIVRNRRVKKSTDQPKRSRIFTLPFLRLITG